MSSSDPPTNTPGATFLDPSTLPYPCRTEYSSCKTGPPYVTAAELKASFSERSTFDLVSLAIFKRFPESGLLMTMPVDPAPSLCSMIKTTVWWKTPPSFSLAIKTHPGSMWLKGCAHLCLSTRTFGLSRTGISASETKGSSQESGIMESGVAPPILCPSKIDLCAGYAPFCILSELELGSSSLLLLLNIAANIFPNFSCLACLSSCGCDATSSCSPMVLDLVLALLAWPWCLWWGLRPLLGCCRSAASCATS
mmetsp:Transcript_5183/g.6342  ORF Transcript_5183/g.6342 Transcript_5183/m.6342 type:complete len:252 (+) Transcript_5183:790-1545(+)